MLVTCYVFTCDCVNDSEKRPFEALPILFGQKKRVHIDKVKSRAIVFYSNKLERVFIFTTVTTVS